jgi:Transposase zinc-ribbon domain
MLRRTMEMRKPCGLSGGIVRACNLGSMNDPADGIGCRRGEPSISADRDRAGKSGYLRVLSAMGHHGSHIGYSSHWIRLMPLAGLHSWSKTYSPRLPDNPQGKYRAENSCIQALSELRLPDGFTCDKCGNTKTYHIASRPCIYECFACHAHHQGHHLGTP